jgi:hypothetical protein
MAYAFNDAIFAQDFLEAFTEYVTPVNAFARDFSSEADKKGSAIFVPLYGALSATTFAYANNTNYPYENSNSSVTSVAIALSNHHIQGVDLTDIQAANSSPSKVERMIKQQASALATRFLQTVWALITTSNFTGAGSVTTAIANWGVDEVRAVRKVLNSRAVPMQKRSLILDYDVEHYLTGDSNLLQAQLYGGTELIRQGKLANVLGFDVYGTNILPANNGSLVGFGCVPDAIAVAMRYLAPQDTGNYQAAFAVTDPDSGITMGYRRHFNPGKGTMFANFEILFGCGVGVTLGMSLITSPD